MLWLIALVVVLLLFLVNMGKIKETLERTNFKEIVRTQRQKDQDEPEPAPVPSAPKVEEPIPPAADSPSSGEEPSKQKPSAQPPSPASEPLAGTPSGAAGRAAPTAPAAPETGGRQAPDASSPSGGSGPKTPAAVAPRSRQASLYFVRIDDDGIIVRQEVKRSVPASDSPLTDALEALLKGPTEEEIRRKLLSLVPAGTRLLGAQVRGSTAFLNFNEAFMYNHYGIEGYAGQLKQVVYTATAFPTVQDVQILIEGERHDYLGGEGVYIGRPLSRNSF